MAAVLAVSATVGPGVAACGTSESSAGGKPTLTWYINPDGGGSDPTKKGQAQIAKECTDAAGGKYAIRVQLLPNSASDQRQQLLRRLAAGDSGIDLMSIDPVFVAEFAEAKFLAPVPHAMVAGFTADTVKAAVEGATWKGNLVAVPFWANTQLLWYRKSVAKAAGLDMSQPVTWAQLIKAAQSQKKTIGVQASRYEGYVVWINALIAGAGGQIVENPGATADQLKLGLETPAGKEAASVIQQVASTGVGGPALSSTTETEALNLFSGSDTSGFLVNWPYTWAALPTNGVKFIDDIGWAKYPETVAGKPSQPSVRRDRARGGRVQQAPRPGVRRGEVHHVARAPEAVHAGHRQPGRQQDGLRRPGDQKQLPMAALIRQSTEDPRHRARRASTTETSPPDCSASSARPTPSTPTARPAAATDLITSVLKGNALL